MEWLTVKEASEFSGYNRQYLQRLCRQGKLQAELKAGSYFIAPASLQAYIKQMQAIGTQKHNWRRKLAAEKQDS